MQEPTRPGFGGRPKRMEWYERTSSIRPYSVLATSDILHVKPSILVERSICWTRRQVSNTGDSAPSR